MTPDDMKSPTTPTGDARGPKPSGAHPHVRRVFLAATATVSAFVVVVAAIVMGGYFWANASISRIPDQPPSASGSTGPQDIAGKCDERACNYLLLGSDSRKGLTPEELIAFGTDAHIGGENRSDTIILVHTRPDRKEVVFLSFPRDLWVDIPGMGEGKINSAFEGGVNGGGAQRVARTVRSISGMQIHHVLYVNLLGFQRVVDALGGVDMCVPYPMKDELTLLDIPAGCQHFDGRTALAYVRTRHQPCDTVPDFARISRQQQFLRAVIAKVLQPGELLKLQDLIPQLLGNLVVDQGLNPAELVYLAGLLQNVGTENADFRALPTVPEGIYDSNGTYVSIVRAIQPEADELMRQDPRGQAARRPGPGAVADAAVARQHRGLGRGPRRERGRDERVRHPDRGRVQHLAGHRRPHPDPAADQGRDDPVSPRCRGRGQGRRHLLRQPDARPGAGRNAPEGPRRRGRRERQVPDPPAEHRRARGLPDLTRR